ncbi:ABC transporter [Microbacterium sp. NPDC055357]
MSDPKSSYGEPVEEPTTVDDVVGRAHEGLADAEAARRDAVDEPAAVEDEQIVVEEEAVFSDETPSAENEWAAEPPSWATDAPLDEEPPSAVEEPAAVVEETIVIDETVVADDEPTAVYEPVVAPAEPIAESVVPPAAVSPQPIFVQAPEAPRLRGNRAAAGAIGLLAALAFAVLYLGATLGFGAIQGDVTAETFATDAVAGLTTWALWVPTVVFFIAFWLLGAIINRGRWAAWVIMGLLVGVAAYGGHLLGQLFQAPFWMLTASEGAELVEAQLLAPLAIVAFVLGRELTIWFGAWAAARGKRVTELNIEAQREYERTLEAGPQLVRP